MLGTFVVRSLSLSLSIRTMTWLEEGVYIKLVLVPINSFKSKRWFTNGMGVFVNAIVGADGGISSIEKSTSSTCTRLTNLKSLLKKKSPV